MSKDNPFIDEPDDGLEPIQDELAPFLKFDHYPVTADITITAFDVAGGTDFDNRPCPELEGELNKPFGDLAAGTLIKLGGGQKKLGRLLRLGADRIKPGSRIVITHTGMLGKMKDFEVSVDPVTFYELAGR
jgi:hypothetical protein